ncbi:hypothetical protein [Serinicoccus sediminis]|uniref:hypothetical protein n=1 Tax=Serinicoccus sediminis TaxID=2306021 RepID=UPI001020312F|nr:hypothetical protein [Serinicoccus sediminis]
MVNRLHPRYTRDRLQARAYTEDPDTWVGTFAEPSTIRAQVEHERVTTATTDGAVTATLLTARIPPRTDGSGPSVDDFPAGTELVHQGHASYVLTARPVTRAGRLVYLEVTAGERPPRATGGIVVAAQLLRSAGWDRAGNPTTPDPVEIPTAVLVAGTTDEPVDGSQQTVTTATLFVPLSLRVASTDAVKITAPAHAAGTWNVDGDPSQDGDRLKVPLRRT